MGKAIEPIARERGHEIVMKLGSKDAIDPSVLASADVAIEFTVPESAGKNIELCFEAKTPVVVGTTGWYDELDEVLAKMKSTGGAILPATNFSLGVNIFLEINSLLARLMDQQPQYNVVLEEIHHTEKLDAPSGTAITIGEGILAELQRKQKWVNNTSENPTDLEIISYRKPEVPGTHAVTYQSEIDQIRIEHIAHSRKGFALGAVIAAEFLAGKQGHFTMKDVLKLN